MSNVVLGPVGTVGCTLFDLPEFMPGFLRNDSRAVLLELLHPRGCGAQLLRKCILDGMLFHIIGMWVLAHDASLFLRC